MIALRLAFCAMLLLDTTSLALAFPKSSGGEACTSTGTVRRDGKDATTGQKMNCQWDTCTFCGTKNGQIDCSILKTEYSNPTDCHPAAIGTGGNLSIFNNGTPLKMSPTP